MATDYSWLVDRKCKILGSSAGKTLTHTVRTEAQYTGGKAKIMRQKQVRKGRMKGEKEKQHQTFHTKLPFTPKEQKQMKNQRYIDIL